MNTVNKVILIGHLGTDVKMHNFDANNCVARFSLATNESYLNKQTNERVTSTEWHNLVFYNKAAELCAKYLSKGDKIYIEGKLKTRKYQDQNGADKYSTEINVKEFTFLSTKQTPTPAGADMPPVNNSPLPGSFTDDNNDDDLPF